MVFKPVVTAAKTWRRLKDENQSFEMVLDITSRNGIEVIRTSKQTAAWNAPQPSLRPSSPWRRETGVQTNG